jgi:hypothetical protein
VAPDALSATFVPTTTLNENTLYQVELTSGITNPSGERPLESFTSFFNTETAPPPNEPLPEASEEVPGPAPAAAAGSALAGTGDLNGDGINDFIAGAPGTNVPEPGGAHQADLVAAGVALLYFGSSDDAELASPDIIFEGEATHDRAGTALAANFDFNGDGVGDLLIGAEQVDRSTDTPVGAGKVYLVYFDPNDTTHYPNINDPNTPDTVSLSLVGQAGGIPGVVFTGQALGDTAGFALDGGGLFNVGTGPDLLIGAPGRDVNTLVDAGTVYIIYDDPTLSGTIDLGQVANTVHGTVVLGSGAGDLLGYSVAWLGPVFTLPHPGARDTFLGNDSAGMGAPGDDNEDENLDDTGTVAALEGGVADDSVVEFDQVGDEEPGHLVRGSQEGEQLGFSLDSGGDNISDGIEDILIGAPGYDRPDGSGDDAGQVVQISDTLPTSGSTSSADIGFGKANGLRGIRWIGEAGDMLGTAVSGLGDVSGDGLDDVAFTAPTADPNGIVDAGEIVVVYGAPAQSYTQDTQDAVDVGTVIPGEILAGTVEGEQTGTAVSDAGDVTGDGEPDVLVGAAEADTAVGIDSGEIFVVTDTTPGDVGECSPDGCLGQDLDTGAQIIVPAGVLEEGESVTAEGVLDPVDLPVAEPIEQSLLGAAEFAVVSGGVEKGVGPEMEATIPVRPEIEAQLTDGEEFDLYEFNGFGWTNTGYIGTVGPNPSYPERKAINGLVPGFGYYTTFIADQDDDGIRDSLDPDRDGDGVDNDRDNCPLDANTSQGDCDFDGVGDVCDPDACEGLRLALSSLTVDTTRAGAMVRWETASEVDVESFQVVRQRETDPPRLISPLIPAIGTPYRGAEYEFRDTGHEIVGVLNYFVAAIGSDGSVDMFGPVIVVPVDRPPGSPREEPKEPPPGEPVVETIDALLEPDQSEN